MLKYSAKKYKYEYIDRQQHELELWPSAITVYYFSYTEYVKQLKLKLNDSILIFCPNIRRYFIFTIDVMAYFWVA